MKTKILILSIAAALPASWALAQNAERPPGPPPEGQRPAGPRDGDRPKGPQGARDGERPKDAATRDGQRPPGPVPIPFLQALEGNGDGIISADEIKGAPDALKKLDKNNDGQLSREEWRPQPPRPPQGDGQRERPAGARDGERPRGGPRDGEAKAEAKAPEKKANDWPFGKKEAAGDQNAAGEKPAGDAQGKGERPQGPPPPPLLEALDTDKDGTISADEIDKASAALAKLDKNNDGQLGPREYGPRPPQGPPPREGGQDGEKPAER